jgi:hypothetical protein
MNASVSSFFVTFPSEIALVFAIQDGVKLFLGLGQTFKPYKGSFRKVI